MQKFFPFLAWIKTYNKSTFFLDLTAGLTVGVLLIPQGIAYAMIAGLPPEYGLYTALIPQIVYAFLGTARQLSIGPVATDSILVAASLVILSETGSDAYIAMAIALSFIVGTLQLLYGFLRLGKFVSYLSNQVISGFISAIAIIIIASQLKHLLGLQIPGSNSIYETSTYVFMHLKEIHVLTFVMGIAGILFIKVSKIHSKRFPSSIIIIVIAITLSYFLNLEQYNINLVGDIPSGLPSFTLPTFDLKAYQILIPSAIVLSIISYLEATTIGITMQKKHQNYELNANQELKALGLANMIGSLFQSYPSTAGFSRTAVNDQSGAKTGVASLVSALVVALVLLFLTPVFYYLPNVFLASIIMVAASNLFDYQKPIELFKTNKIECLLLVFTFTCTLTFGIVWGIVLGIALSAILGGFKYLKGRK